MKIHNNNLPGTTPLDATRTQPAPQTGAGSGLTGKTIAGHEGDSVQISGISAHLTDANALDTQQRANRVAELAAQYARGSYQVDASSLSNALISNSIGSPEGGTQ